MLKLFKCSEFPTVEQHLGEVQVAALQTIVAKYLASVTPEPAPSLFRNAPVRPQEGFRWSEIRPFLLVLYGVHQVPMAGRQAPLAVGVLAIRLLSDKEGFEERYKVLRSQLVWFIKTPHPSEAYRSVVVSLAQPKIHFLVEEYLSYHASMVVKPVAVSSGLIAEAINHTIMASKPTLETDLSSLGDLELGFDATKHVLQDSLKSLRVDIPACDYPHFLPTPSNPSFVHNVFAHLRTQTAIDFNVEKENALNVSQARFGNRFMVFQSGKVKFFGLDYELEWSLLAVLVQGLLHDATSSG